MDTLRVAPCFATPHRAFPAPKPRRNLTCSSQSTLPCSQISWSSAISSSHAFLSPPPVLNLQSQRKSPPWIVEAAWTRRSKAKNGTSKNRKSWKQRTEKFFKPFILDVFISSKYVHAKVMHRVTSSVVSVATTNAKDLRLSLPSLVDKNACKVIGQLIAERSLAADVYAVAFDLRKNEKLEGKLALVIDSAIEHGLTLVLQPLSTSTYSCKCKMCSSVPPLLISDTRLTESPDSDLIFLSAGTSGSLLPRIRMRRLGSALPPGLAEPFPSQRDQTIN